MLAAALADAGRGEALEALSELLVERVILSENKWLSAPDRDRAVADEIRERLESCTSDAYAHQLFAMAAEYDDDCEDFLFPDGRGEMIFIPNSVIESHAECLLERYIDYINTYSDYELIHPSDYSGPREVNEDKEWGRLVWDFAWMLREWRDGFLRKLVADCARRKDEVIE